MVIDYGTLVPFAEVSNEPAAKKFRGALEACFDGQRSASSPGAVAPQPQNPVTPKTGPTPDPGSKDTTILSENVALTGYLLKWRARPKPDLFFEAGEGVTGNKKVAPRSVLALWQEGDCKEAAGVDPPFPWAYTNAQALVAWKKEEGFTVGTLKDIVEQSGASMMFRYGTFPAPGKVPNALVAAHPQGKMGFHPPGADTETFVALRDALAAQGSKASARLVWIVTVKDGKIMPAGTALVNSKQVTVKVASPTPLIE